MCGAFMVNVAGAFRVNMRGAFRAELSETQTSML